MPRIENLNDFKVTLSFQELCGHFLDKIFDKISGVSTSNDFVIGYHIRHFLDSDAPTYRARPKNIDKQVSIDKIIEKNKCAGKHTINHIIDNLYYKKEANRDTLINIQFTFDRRKTPFTPISSNEFNCTNAEVNFGSIKFTTEYNIAADIEKLVKELDLDPNFENIKSIFNAIDQIRSYKEYGKIIQCLILRPANQFGYVVGVSLISDSYFNMQQILLILEEDFKLLNHNGDKSDLIKQTGKTNSILNKIDDYKPFKLIFQTNKLPEQFYKNIIKIEDDLKVYIANKALINFGETVESFIRLLSEFCDEKIEGNPLSYGFVLGNPGLLNFLKNNDIFPSILHDEKEKFSSIDALKSNIHLFANHEITSIVIPYIDYFDYSGDEEPLPTFVLPMKSFEEDIFGWDEGTLIPATYRPYGFLSYRFPWLISAVVGPYSQIRLFKGGKIVAYKDGKGWKAASISSGNITEIYAFSSISDKAKLQKFVDFALLFSPIYNPNSHGGFITYVDGLDDLDESIRKEYQDCFEPLVNKTYAPHNGNKWLNDECLFHNNSNGIQNVLNIDVCSRLLQTCVLDGAISIEGSSFEVKSFGNRLNFKVSEESVKDIRKDKVVVVSGTKRKTAMEFVRWCSSKGLEKYFAIAISADGPLRIFFDKKDSDGKKVLSEITIFKLMK